MHRSSVSECTAVNSTKYFHGQLWVLLPIVVGVGQESGGRSRGRRRRRRVVMRWWELCPELSHHTDMDWREGQHQYRYSGM